MINIYNIFVRMKICGSLTLFFVLLSNLSLTAQAPSSFSASDIMLKLQKLKVLGSALYIAAHPDDENTRLLGWFSKDQLLRTGYLSITRGDGGQNLIGEEQGVELGLIRTQELLAARRVDGAEQFFTRAFDFGYSKSTEEALRFWNKETILGDVVWVIRKFQPDVIITRFPPDKRAGHGHHSASAVLAAEAFKLAADEKAYPEQLKYGVKPWRAERILWNSYIFGSINTTSKEHMKIEVGGFSPLLGKSYGEIAAESRSQHKSQGFGVPASRGGQLEYFSHTDGARAESSLTSGVDMSWARIGATAIATMIDRIISNYSVERPSASIPALVVLYRQMKKLPAGYWPEIKRQELRDIIAACSGLWMEGFATKAFATQGDSLTINVSVNNRDGASVKLKGFAINALDTNVNVPAPRNINLDYQKTFVVDKEMPVSQPYWLREKMGKGSFTINDQEKIGLPESKPAFTVRFDLEIEGERFQFNRPVHYKHTDPVKGELYEPLIVVPARAVSSRYGTLHHINYDHIPDIYYFNGDTMKIELGDVKIDGRKIGYIEGAGDKVPEALALMGYQVTMIRPNEMNARFLSQFDAIITGVRAYNVHGYLVDKNDVLNEYVKNGGNLVIQYNTNSFVGPNNAKIGPLPFNISRDRITDEGSPVAFLAPDHQVLNYPNKITQRDFENWVQERGIYFADQLDPAFSTPLAMNDPDEKPLNGSLVIAEYGKGRFVYTGLAFFRQLPAGVEGAYRLIANIIALNKQPK